MKHCIYVLLLLTTLISFKLLGAHALDLHRLASVEYTDNGALLALGQVVLTQEELLKKDSDGRTPFHVAIKVGKLHLALKLVDADRIVLDECDANFYSPIHTAVENKCEDTVKFLLEMGADPANSCNRTKPLSLLLEGIPNFRRPEASGANLWPICSNIVNMMSPQIPAADLQSHLAYVRSLKESNKKRSDLIKNHFEYPLQSALDAVLVDSQKMEMMASHGQIEESAAMPICTACNESIKKSRQRSYVSNGKMLGLCNSCGLRAKKYGCCTKCYYVYYLEDKISGKGVCQRQTCSLYRQ